MSDTWWSGSGVLATLRDERVHDSATRVGLFLAVLADLGALWEGLASRR